jgi:penicillin amidase
MKTAHPASNERHKASYGSNARHISDLSDEDANYFVLLGGQDGWLNSSTFLDQVDLWRAGRYLRMPLRLETVRAEFPRRMEVTP